MAIVVLQAPPSILLTTLDKVKAELNITDSSQDDILYDLLSDASSAITRECGRPFFGVGTYTETLKGSGSQLLPLSCVPVLNIQTVYQDEELLSPIDPTNPTDPNLNDGYYIEDAEAGAIYRPGGWGQSPALMSWGWEAYSSRYILPGGTNTLRYTVTYTAGYVMPGEEYTTLEDRGSGYSFLYDAAAGTNPGKLADPSPLPGDIRRACLATVKSWWFARARDVAVSQVQTRNQKVVYDPQLSNKALPAYALGLLRDYRRVN